MVVALAFAIVLPRHAITIRPPGTVSMILPVDGLGVGELDVEAPETDGDGEMDTDGDPVGVEDPLGVGVGVGVEEAVTAPPTALPSTQVKTYSMPGGVGSEADGEGDGGGVVVTAAVADTEAFGLECDGLGDVVGGLVGATDGVMTRLRLKRRRRACRCSGRRLLGDLRLDELLSGDQVLAAADLTPDPVDGGQRYCRDHDAGEQPP